MARSNIDLQFIMIKPIELHLSWTTTSDNTSDKFYLEMLFEFGVVLIV